MFRQLDDRLTRYHPPFLKLFSDSATRPRQREVLIEFLREGKVEEAVRGFKKIYLEVVRQMIDYLDARVSEGFVQEGGRPAKKKAVKEP